MPLDLDLTEALPPRRLRAQVVSVQRLSHHMLALTLGLPVGTRFDFLPGQFARLRFARKLPARSYAMASAPGQAELTFHIQLRTDGVVSPYVATQLCPGDAVELHGPFGEATWQREQDDVAGGRLLLVAEDTGLAPMLCILDAMLRDGVAPGRIHLLHGAAAEGDLHALEQLQQRQRQHGFRLVTVLSQTPAPGHRFGEAHEALAQDYPDLRGARVYVAGSPAMVKAVSRVVRSRGVSSRRLHAEPFGAAEPEKRTLWERITGWGAVDNL